ncbi:transcriptional regulator TetR family [Methanobrevibacter ruminantium M1]|uniref:Transcriptional regulator TetR family n=1 Tax=Methanobrevibacter ruminantium (strain ATCC 35063 / DSM 1093 / JCM 13430 / OCM 146 / M1) TaxID=634498 RepID=D3E1T5_METRM|nr:helix-turn-helix domain-containing protein [Methanobrevibacter ruminantium]ADC46496.1 transcriptional regulator TetR family [Methanobrevibacter ruminantium M1]
MNTKEKIFDVSLDLFSKRGYDSVSLREIAEEVGIKKSSIYSHYSSKEAILMDIFEYFTDLFEYDDLINSKELVLSEDNDVLIENPELFYHMGSEAIRGMFKEERNLKIWKLIFIQMHYNEKIRNFFQKEMLLKPLIFWENFFAILKEKGIIRADSNPQLLAKEYYSFPIFLLLEICAKYDDIPESCLDDFFKQAEEHARFLLDCVKVK